MNQQLSELTDRYAEILAEGMTLASQHGVTPKSNDEFMDLWKTISPETYRLYQEVKSELLSELTWVTTSGTN